MQQMLSLLGPVVLLGLVALALGPALLSSRARRAGWYDDHTRALDAIPVERLPWLIALAAGTALFAELMMIRLHASYFHLFGYFKNISLLSCFLGLGVGYARGRISPVATPAALPLLAFQIALLYVLRHHPLALQLGNPVAEQATMGMNAAATTSGLVAVYTFIAVVFYVNALCFVPLGQVTGRLMARTEALPSYGWNLIGSLAGIAAFAAAAYLWTPPSAWFLIAAVGVLVFLWSQPRHLLVSGLVSAVIAVTLQIPTGLHQREVYSPYQLLAMDLSDPESILIRTNSATFQRIHDFGNEDSRRRAAQLGWLAYYDFPFDFKEKPGRVLVVGAGTGNDVAAALRHDAEHVDAVEIDPAIVRMGRQLHPEGPYQDERVRVINDDARAWLRTTDQRYDLVVYGLLDSHVLLSGRAGGVRLDSYVYTREGIEAARSRLDDDGVLTLTFSLMSAAMGKKLYLMLEEAFDGVPPKVYVVGYAGGVTFIAGPGLAARGEALPERFREVSHLFTAPDVHADVATDDWPFFYMPVRRYPTSYLSVIAILVIVSGVFLLQLAPRREPQPASAPARERVRFSLPCFFLGAGFMLVETKGITQLAVVYSNTWVVVSAVIAGILVMAFLANWYVWRFGRPRLEVVYGLLAAALAVGYGLSFYDLGELGSGTARVLMTVVLSLPFLFSGLAFSAELDRTQSTSAALSANLLGAMLGGFLEYNAMLTGYRALYLMAFVLYLAAYLSSSRAPAARAAEADEGQPSGASAD